MAGASTERCIYSPSSAFSYVHICFSLFLEKQACLSWEHPLCWNHTCSECVVSGSDVFALRPEICGIQEAAYLQSKHCVAEHRLIQQHGCVQYKQDLTPFNNTVQIHTGWHRCCFGHHFKKKQNYSLKFHTQVSCEPRIQIYNKLHTSQWVIFKSCATPAQTHLPLAGLERTALLPHFWEKSAWKKKDITELSHHTGGHSVCVCLLDCTYETCVRLLAVLWGMVLLGSSFRKLNTGMGPGSLELWTSSKGRMTKGRLTSEAVWGDNKSGPKPRRLSRGGCSSRIAHSPSSENTPIMVLLYGSKTWAAVSTFLCLFVSFLHPRLFKNRKSIHARSQYSFSKAPPVHPKTSGSRSDHKEFWIPIIISHWPFHVKDRQQANILFIALKETQQMTISC